MWEGALHGALPRARSFLGLVSALLLLSSTTKGASDLPCPALYWVFRKGWVEVAMLMYRYIFMLMDRPGISWTPKGCGLDIRASGAPYLLRASLAGTVIKAAMEQGIRTCEAMELQRI